MNSNYQYPEKVDADDQFTPELMVLWKEAMNNLRKKRNLGLVWQVPIFFVSIIVIFSTGHNYVMVTGFIFLAILGTLSKAMSPSYEYIVAHDRSSAEFQLKHIFRLKLLLELPISVLSKAKDGFEGLLLAIASIVFFPLWWAAISVLASFSFLNNLWWLKGFTEWTGRLQKITDGSDNRQHIRGTNILPSVQLSGTAPTEAAPPPIPQGPLEVLDGLLTLFPDGGIALVGGVVFDRHSTFSNFSMNGLTLTRESEAQLKVSHEGSNRSFGFDGSSWKEI